MKRCSSCSTSNPASNRFCQNCGKPLPAHDVTVQMSQTLVRNKPGRQSFDVKALFGGRDRLIVGRAEDCDIRLDHPSVSRYHARLERQGELILVSDLSSVNGVWVGGLRVAETARLKDGDKVGIGPYLLTLSAGVLQSLDSSRSLRLDARHLEYIVSAPSGPLKILDNISLVVNPGEFVALLGPSGSGKSTLMDCLNGRRRATGGLVLANGENFYRHYDSFRQSLGYVPQKDIVHTELTVARALLYTARLRLPLDSAPEEINARMEDVLKQMGLEARRDTPVGQLSGGQIKRVSLGAELLGQPALLYIDEATSGLDAGTERRMMHLFRELADEGRSLLCITHNVENVDRCHLILVLARGKLIYYGPPTDAPHWFKVPRISDIYDRIAERDVTEWERDFRASDLYREYVTDRLAAPSGPGTSPSLPVVEASAEDPPASGGEEGLSGLISHVPMLADQFRTLEQAALRLRERLRPMLESWHQFRVLTERYIDLILGDMRNLRLMLMQSPLVAFILLLGFIGKPFNTPMPLLRPLEPEEKRTLQVLRGLGGLFSSEGELPPQQQAALQRLRIQAAGVPVEMDGTRIVALLRKLQSGNLTLSERTALEETTFDVPSDEGPLTISAAEAVSVWRRFQESQLPEHLLNIEGPAVPYKEWKDPRYPYTLLFILSVVVLWFGCNNACREIVKEESIYARERAVNLRTVPYLASKFLVLIVITTLQVSLLMLCVYGPLEYLALYWPGHTVPPSVLMLGYGWQLVVFTLLGMTGVAMGLLLSAVVTSADRANALLPYVLIPQMILGGGFISVTGLLYWVAAFVCPVYWAFRAVHLGANVLPVGFPGHASDADGILWPCLALVAQAVALLVMTYIALRRKEA